MRFPIRSAPIGMPGPFFRGSSNSFIPIAIASSCSARFPPRLMSGWCGCAASGTISSPRLPSSALDPRARVARGAPSAQRPRLCRPLRSGRAASRALRRRPRSPSSHSQISTTQECAVSTTQESRLPHRAYDSLVGVSLAFQRCRLLSCGGRPRMWRRGRRS